MAEIRYETSACECCTLLIANGDDSGCRDYWNHTHKPATLPARVVRQLDEDHPELAGNDWSAWLIVVGADEPAGDESWIEEIAACELCGQSGYMAGYPVAVVR